VLDAPAAKTFPLISNLDASVAAELVSIVDRKVRFRHPLVRSAVHQAAALRNVEQIRPNADTRQREDESGGETPGSWFPRSQSLTFSAKEARRARGRRRGNRAHKDADRR
jgi:hypothetical protein